MNKFRNGAFALTLVAVVAGCGDGGPETESAAASQLSGANISIGTKGFTEHFILTQMTKLLLEDAGASVTVRDLPSTQQVRLALQGGELDMYWEYTGTGWTNFLGHDTASTAKPEELYAQVAEEDLQKNDVKWLPPANFSNTYGIAASAEVAKDLDLQTISDVAQLAQSSPEKLTLCVDESFGGRPDGLPALEQAYGFDWPQQQITVSDYALVFPSIDAAKPCNFGAVYSTDGRLPALGLTLLNDDKNVFLSYLPAITMMEPRYAEVGQQVEQLIAPILGLDEAAIAELNAAVDVDGQFPEDVAEDWLREQGLL